MGENEGIHLSGLLQLEPPQIAVLDVVHQIWARRIRVEEIPRNARARAVHVEDCANGPIAGLLPSLAPAKRVIVRPKVSKPIARLYQAMKIGLRRFVMVEDQDRICLIDITAPQHSLKHVALVAEIHDNDVLVCNVRRGLTIDAGNVFDAIAEPFPDSPRCREAIGAISVVDTNIWCHAARSFAYVLQATGRCASISLIMSWSSHCRLRSQNNSPGGDRPSSRAADDRDRPAMSDSATVRRR